MMIIDHVNIPPLLPHNNYYSLKIYHIMIKLEDIMKMLHFWYIFFLLHLMIHIFSVHLSFNMRWVWEC